MHLSAAASLECTWNSLTAFINVFASATILPMQPDKPDRMKTNVTEATQVTLKSSKTANGVLLPLHAQYSRATNQIRQKSDEMIPTEERIWSNLGRFSNPFDWDLTERITAGAVVGCFGFLLLWVSGRIGFVSVSLSSAVSVFDWQLAVFLIEVIASNSTTLKECRVVLPHGWSILKGWKPGTKVDKLNSRTLDWLADWSTDWSTDWPTDWLISWCN